MQFYFDNTDSNQEVFVISLVNIIH